MPTIDEEIAVDGIERPLRKVVNNTFAIAFARFFMPIALAVVGYFMVTTLNDIHKTNDQIWSYLNKLSDNLQRQQVDIATLRVQTDNTSKQVDRLTITVDSIKLNTNRPQLQ